MTAEPNLELYTTAAQVIPLFFVVLAFDLHATGRAQFSPFAPTGRAAVITPLLLLALMAVGEAAAVQALIDRRASPELREAVTAALFGGGLMIVVSVSRSLLSIFDDDRVDLILNTLIAAAIASWVIWA